MNAKMQNQYHLGQIAGKIFIDHKMKNNVVMGIIRLKLSFIRILLPLLGIGMSLISCKEADVNEKGFSESLKIASYNIEYDNKSNWSSRKTMVRELLKRYNFDIIGVQEPYARQITDIMESLPDYSYLSSNVLGTTKDGVLSNLIIYKKNRIEVHDFGKFWYSETPDVASKGWDASQYRICVWAKFKDKATNKEFYHFNSHFDNTGDIARVESAKMLLAKIKLIANDYPVFATGDFNSSQSSEPYLILTSSTFCGDSYKWSSQKVNANWTTYNGYSYSATPVSSTRIDHLFFSPNNSVISYWKVLNDSFSGKYPSDHFPVMAYWLINK